MGGVGEELRDIDVVPVGSSLRVHESLAVLAAVAVQLIIAGPHEVQQVHVAGPQAD